MARVTYGAVITEIKGSVGGTVFQGNAYGYTMKNKPKMIKPNTPSQLTQQYYFSKAVKAWNQLTSSQRSAWNTWAATNPQYAKNNPSSVLTGFAVFVKVNVFRLMAGTASSGILVSPSASVYDVDNPTFVCELDDPHLYLDISWDNEDSNLLALFSVTRVFPNTQNFVGTSARYMFAKINEGTLGYDLANHYVETYGALPGSNEYFYIVTQMVGKDNGQVFATITDSVQAVPVP